ncbi:hypothetical protein PQX77_008942 [Marasmius sp. AFHP31]|nr:hypothetical protein PQX77_008942 [Marasmius sp. AFHP31]
MTSQDVSGITKWFSAVCHLEQIPPSNLDADSLSPEASESLDSLCTIHKALVDSSVNAVPFVERFWNQIWPWVLKFSISALKEGSKSSQTERGTEFVYAIISITPVIFTYRKFDGNGDLDMMLESTPELLTLALEMWLLATTREHPCTESHCRSFGQLLDRYLASETSYEDGAGKYLKATLNRKQGVVMDGVIRNNIRCITPREVRLHNLREILKILEGLVDQTLFPRSHPADRLLLDSLARDGVKWVAYTFRRLSSSTPWRKRYKRRQHHDLVKCISLCWKYFDICAQYDVAAVAKILDEDVITYMFKSSGILAYDMVYREQGPIMELAERYRHSITLLSLTRMHRPVLIRLVRSIKKVQRLDLEGAFEKYPSKGMQS